MKYSLTFAKISKISPKFSHNSGSQFLLATFLLNIQLNFLEVFTNNLRIFYIFSKTFIQYFLNSSKNVAMISKVHSTFLWNIRQIFSKWPYNFFQTLPYIFYIVCFIYKIRFLVLEPSSNSFKNRLFFWNFFYNTHKKYILNFPKKLSLKCSKNFQHFFTFPPLPNTPTKNH